MASNSPPPPRSEPPPPLLTSNITKKRRGGRQLRQVALSAELKFAIRQFAAEVGMPRLMEPTGFRDFRGWLERVSGPSAANAWSFLVQAMITEAAADPYRILIMKEEVVREIVRAIVVPRPGESAKLVSTNCGRQCARPRSGNTLMTILERILVDRGVVARYDLEAFMSERSTPQSYVLRDYQLSASASSPRQAPPSPNRHSMSLDAITERADAAGPSDAIQHIAPPFSTAPIRTHGASSAVSRDSYSSSNPQSPNSRRPRRTRSYPDGRLPSFKELEDSLKD